MSTATVESPKSSAVSHRIASLDGWRGIAILGVLVEHFVRPRVPSIGHSGGYGVTLFFVLSGYLITGNLLRESENGGIRLRRFYLRRIFRLWPCAWTYQLVVLFLLALATHRVMWRDALRCIVFARNYGGSTILTEHFWSLSIEEQFYLVWPLALVLFRKRAMWVAIAGILFVTAFRVTHWGVWIDHIHYVHSMPTQFRADALLAGCIVAMLKQRYPRLLSNVRLLATVTSALLLTAAFTSYASRTAGIFAIGAALLLTIHEPRLNRAFSYRPLSYLGLISYSLYVWQQLFAHISRPVHPWLALIAIPVAILSYEYIERTGIRFGAKLMAAKDRTPVPTH